MSKIHYTQCPVCGSSDFKKVLEVKDYMITNEVFPIAECRHCLLRFTQDVPDGGSISPYYKSEDYISHTSTFKGFIGKLYQSVRKRTLRRKHRMICKATSSKTGTLLDLGSGIGSFVKEMNEAGWETTGLEPDEDARKIGKQLYAIELKNTDELFRLPSNHFDAITLWHVLEHVHELQSYIQQLKKLLKENGKLFIAVPNYTAADAAIYKEYWAAYDVPRHLYHFSPHSIDVLMEKNGLKVEQYKPMWYDSFYISLLSSKYKTGKSRLLSSFFNGLRSNIAAIGNPKKCSSVIYIIAK